MFGNNHSFPFCPPLCVDSGTASKRGIHRTFKSDYIARFCKEGGVELVAYSML